MLYSALWRALPGPTPVRVLLSLVLLVAVIAFCFLWLFPRIAPLMPFNDNTVDPQPAGASTAYHPDRAHPAPQALQALQAHSASRALAEAVA